MFRRTTTPETGTETGTDDVSAEEAPPGAGAAQAPKGRPTPSRKEAQAAARERARAPRGSKEARRQQKDRRVAQNRKMREGMRSGDERYLPARDQGPVKRFVRDFVDSRLCFAEFLLPLLIVILVLSQSSDPTIMSVANGVWTATFLLTLVDTGWMLFRLRRALRERFPAEETKGTTFYAVMRVLQMRFMRMPKAKVRLGGRPKG